MPAFLDDLLEKPSLLRALRLGLVLSWGSLIRPEGFLLLLTLPAALVYERRWKDLAAVYAAPLVCWTLFAWRWLKASQEVLHTEYGGDLAMLLFYWLRHPAELVSFSVKLLSVLMVNTLTGLRSASEPAALAAGAGLLAVGLWAMATGFQRLWKEKRLHRGMLISMVLFYASYFMVHVFWHVAVPRYCVVLLPIVLVLMVPGFTVWLSRSRHPRALISVAASLFILSYGWRNGYGLYQSLWVPQPMYGPPWRSLEWLDRHTPESSGVLSTVAPSVMLYANRPAITLMTAANGEDFLFLLTQKHLDYVLDRKVKALTSGIASDDDPTKTWDRIRRWLALYPRRFVVIFEDPVEKVTIYRVVPEPEFVAAYEKYREAIADFQGNREAQAIEKLRQSLRLFPSLGSAHNAMGVTYYLPHQDAKGAKNAFLKAIQAMPDSSITMLNLAALYHAEGQSEKSLAYVALGFQVSAANEDQTAFIQRLRAMQDRRDIELPDNFLAHFEIIGADMSLTHLFANNQRLVQENDPAGCFFF